MPGGSNRDPFAHENGGTLCRMPPWKNKQGLVAASATTTTTAAAAAATLFAGLGFVHLEGAATNVFTVEGFHGGVHFAFGAHCHESKATWLSAFAVHRHVHVRHAAVLGEEGFEILFGRIKRQVANIHFHLSRVVHALCFHLRLFPLVGFQIATESLNSSDNTPDLDPAKS
jgi:hypothetical protein